MGAELLQRFLGQLLVGLHQHFAGLRIDHVVSRDASDHFVKRDRNLADLGCLQRAHDRLVELAALARQHLARLRILHVAADLGAEQLVGLELLGELFGIENQNVLAVVVV